MRVRSRGSGSARSCRAALLSALALVAVVSACSQSPAASPEPSAATSIPSSVPGSPTDTATPSPTDTATQSPTDTASPTGSTSTPTPGGTPAMSSAPPASPGEATATGSPPVLDRTAAGRDLKVADFFSAPVEWRDGVYDVASARGLVGVSGPLRHCNENEADAQTFELRLANNFTKLSMRVGQANNSESSDAEVLVRAVGNGTFIDSTRVKFNKLQDMSVAVGQVNALKLEVFMTGKKCDENKGVNAVLTSIRLE